MEKLFPSKSIESILPQKTPLMPAGLASAMTKDEFRDLLAFLQGLK